MTSKTDDLLASVRAELERIGSGATKKVDALAARLERMESDNKDNVIEIRRLQDGLSMARRAGGGFGMSLGEAVVHHDAFKAMQSQGLRSVKMTITSADGPAAGAAGALVEPHRDADIVAMPRRRLSLRQLLNSTPTTSNMIQFPRQTVRTNSAAPAAEASQKGESNLGYELAEAPVRTIAHFVKVSRQVLDDAAALAAEIDTELRYGLNLVTEQQLLYGTGIGQNIAGLMTQSTAYNGTPTTGVTRIDVLLKAIKQAELADVPATGIVLNSGDWLDILGLKDQDGRYIVPGGPASTAPPVLWGLPVVPTNSVIPSEFLVGAFGLAARVYSRMDVEVLISSEDSDNFQKNLVTIRAETRLALAIRQPLGLIRGDFDTAITG